MKTKSLILLLFFTSPVFFWQIQNKTYLNFRSQIQNIPAFTTAKVTSLLSPQTIDNIKEYRRDLKNPLSRIFYNKATAIFPQAFHYLNILKPRVYFQSGTGTADFPSRTEPLPLLLIPFVLLGFFYHIKKQKYRPLILFTLSPFLAFITGQYNFLFLLPGIFAYLYFSAVGINLNPHSKKIIALYLIYALFLSISNFLTYEA